MLPPEAVRLHTAQQFRGEGRLEHYEIMWASCLRLIEHDRPDYRS